MKFYGTASSFYGIQINFIQVIAPHMVNTAPFYIGYHVVNTGDHTFTFMNMVTFHGTITPNNTTGASELSSSSVSELVVFPNPTNGDFKIKFNSTRKKNDLAIYDIQGRMVFENKGEGTVGRNEFVVNNEFASGIYIIRLEDKSFKITVTR